MKRISLLFFVLSCIYSCSPGEKKADTTTESNLMTLPNDPHSYSRPNDARVKHLEWMADIDFSSKIIHAKAIWTIEKTPSSKEIIFDAKDLHIKNVTVNNGETAPFELSPSEKFMGSALTIKIPENCTQVSIEYSTSPEAGALLWVEGEKPFLFTQSQAILARTWLPCQDSPGIRFTYNAQVNVPEGLLVLMSAENPQQLSAGGKYSFKMEQAIPSYLMALAVGDIVFKPLGERCGIYATPELIEAAANEFIETEQMLVAAEALYGPYAWGRYDLLILPPAFPFGGMENPRITFATPTIIAGDRSLTALVAHEMAHSWSGNLVTNATWNDFWLNEGFTVYFENRIMEAVYGSEISEMLVTLSYQGLLEEVAEISAEEPADTHLKLKLEGRDPDHGMSAIAYDKGYFFLRLIEETTGRERFDKFLKNYFAENAFGVMDTERFLDYLKTNLLSAEETQNLNIDEWVYKPGLPANCPQVNSERIKKVDEAIAGYLNGSIRAKGGIDYVNWLYQERYRFLTNLPADLGFDKMKELDLLYEITATQNNEVLFAWLELSIKNGYTPAYDRLRTFLVGVGRRKFLTPLYKAMLEKGEVEMANSIYKEARPHYHAVAKGTMDELLNYKP
jgi:aminopeptidase N